MTKTTIVQMSIDHITSRETVLYATIEKLEATNKELLEALLVAVDFANCLHMYWDAGQDSKVGKGLLVLAGTNPKYNHKIDSMHAAIARATGEAK